MRAFPPPVHRIPKNYGLVRQLVEKHGRGHHLTTADVHALAKDVQAGIGFTTVYRALNRLVQLHLVSEVRVPGADTTYYESVTSPHAHFRCDACGRVEDVDYQLPSAALTKIARTHGLDVTEALVNLSGRCGSCRQT